MRKTTLLLTLAMLAIGGCESHNHEAPTPSVRLDVERYKVPLQPDDYALGGEDALVTIVVFSDYACGPCRNLWDTMRRIHEDYGDDVRIVARSVSVPGFEAGGRAAEAAFAAGAQGKFWPMHWRLFEYQEDLSEPVLRAHAKALGLDTEAFDKALDEGVFAGRKLRDRRRATELGIVAAPIVFINGMVLVGPKPDEAMWHGLIDAELKQVRESIAAGGARKDIYASLQKGSLDKPLPRPKEVAQLKEQLDETAPKAPKFDYSKIVKPDPAERYDVPLDGTFWTGPEDAPVVIVEFTDFQCPFCRRMHVETLAKLREQRPDDVRIVVRNMPLEVHREARGAAKAAIAAGRQGRYWEFHDRLYAAVEGLGYQTFKSWAAEMGLDVAQFEKDFKDPDLEKLIGRDQALSYMLGLTATPSLFINGRFFEGFMTLEQANTRIDEEIAAMKAAGRTRANNYAELMKSAKSASQFPNAPKAKAEGGGQQGGTP